MLFVTPLRIVNVTKITYDSICNNFSKTVYFNFKYVVLFICLMEFNTTFNNISTISWRSVSLVEETGGSGENHRPVASHWQILSHNVVHIALIEIRTHNIQLPYDHGHDGPTGQIWNRYHPSLLSIISNSLNIILVQLIFNNRYNFCTER